MRSISLQSSTVRWSLLALLSLSLSSYCHASASATASEKQVQELLLDNKPLPVESEPEMSATALPVAVKPAPIADHVLMANSHLPIIKKTIVVAAFEVNKPRQVLDIDDIAHGLSDQISRRLNHSDQFIALASRYSLPLTLDSDLSLQDRVRQLATTYNAQYVITGEIRNLGSYTEKKFWGLKSTDKRSFEVDLILCDGITGEVLARHELQQLIIDNTKLGHDTVFGSTEFYATAFGQATYNLLNDAARLVTQDLVFLPEQKQKAKTSATMAATNMGQW